VKQKTHLIVDQRRQRQIIKQIREKLPHIRIPILSQTLVVEPVHLGDLSGFMVSSENGDTIPVAEFERDEEGDGFDRVVATIDVVAHEEVVCVGRVAADSEEFREVVLEVL
jgi:hypothetical protein